jgi:hypothetical protein
MAFTFAGPTLSGHIDENEAIIFDMVRLVGLHLPPLTHLEKEFYESPHIAREKVAELRHEALQAMRRLQAARPHHPSVLQRALAAQTPVFRESAEKLKPWDPERCLASLVAVCDDAMQHEAGIDCISD